MKGSLGRLSCDYGKKLPAHRPPCGQPLHQEYRRQGLIVTARGYPSGGGSRIIMPGDTGRNSQQSNNQQQSKLILPGRGERGGGGDSQRDSGGPGGQKKISIDTSGIQGPSTSTFRPPPGFMDSDKPLEQAFGPLDMEETRVALDRLRSNAGHWHELAKLLPRLAMSGYDSQVVEMETGLERVTQNAWMVAQSVYDSLKKSDAVPPETLAHFDNEEGANQLYYMRYLSDPARPATAIYIVENQLDAQILIRKLLQESAVLERAVKEQERREGHREGFSSSPADCLAYKYYRDATESRNEDVRQRLVRKGLELAETETAIKALNDLKAGQSEAEVTIKQIRLPNINIVRLTGDEVEFRPIPLVGPMATTTAEAVAAAVGVKQSGPYNSFTLTPESSGQEFVALPAYRSLLLARSPVCVSLQDCAEQPLVLRAVGAKSEEEKQRQAGPGLVVINRQLEEEPSSTAFYLKRCGEALQIVEGSNLADLKDVCGTVLFICKPPARTAEARLDSYALYSL